MTRGHCHVADDCWIGRHYDQPSCKEYNDGAQRSWEDGLGNRTHTTQKYNILPQSTTSDFARRA